MTADIAHSTAATDTVSLCPVMGSFVHDGELPGGTRGRTGMWSIYLLLRRLGLTAPLSIALMGLVPLANGPWALPRNLCTLSIDVHRMVGRILDHGADSGVLHRGRFDPAAFDALVAHSSDGRTLDVADLGRLLAADRRRSPSAFGTFMSLVEFATLLRVFGERADDLDHPGLRLPVPALRSLYGPQHVPAGWAPMRTTGLVAEALTIRAIARAMREAMP